MTTSDNNEATSWFAGRRFRASIAICAAFVAIELLLSWSYVAKRVLADQPFPDLLVQYYVLEPFARLFHNQFVFPEDLWSIYTGDLENPRAAAQWWIADPLLGHRNAPNSLVTENRWSYRQTNSQGFVVTDRTGATYGHTPANGVFRIIVLGGSTVEGNGASSSLAAIPAALARVLEAYLPAERQFETFEVINAGVSGYFSTTELLYYLSELRHFRPDLVISYNGWNDLQLQNRALEQEGLAAPYLWNTESREFAQILNGHFRWDAAASNFLQRTVQGIVARLRGFAIFDILLRAAIKIVPATGWGGANSHGEEPAYYYDRRSVLRYTENIAHLNWAVQRDGSSHAWFMQPLAGVGNHPPASGGPGFDELVYQTTNANRIARRNRFYADTRSAMADMKKSIDNICTADLSLVFDGSPEPVYDDPGHLNDRGNEIVAIAIARELEKCGLIRARRDQADTKRQ